MNSDFIKKMVNDRQIELNRYSIFVTALEHARQLSGFDKETRMENRLLLDINNNSILELGQSQIGLINYLLILDMLGSVFKKVASEAKEKKRNSITYVLEQFSILNDKRDRDAIKALRNCLAHNYSLLNIPEWKDESDIKYGKENIKTNAKLEANELHAFSICWKKQPSLIKYPDNANRLTKSNPLRENKHYTEICAERLRDLVEGIFQQIKEGVNNGSVGSDMSDEEIKSRFTYCH